MNADVTVDPAELFEHVYARPTAALERQRAALLDGTPNWKWRRAR